LDDVIKFEQRGTGCGDKDRMRRQGQDAETRTEFSWLAWGPETICSNEQDSNLFGFTKAAKYLKNNS
jgi:hypothetical protein